MRICINLERKYSSKFKNIHTQLPPNGQGISGCVLRVASCGFRATSFDAGVGEKSKGQGTGVRGQGSGAGGQGSPINRDFRHTA